RQSVRVNRVDEDRRVGRIDLAVGGRARQILRQLAGGGIDRGLDVLRSGVYVAVEIELHGDLGGAEHALRGELRDARDVHELVLERCCNRGGHGLRTRAREVGAHQNGREVDLRQRRDGQQREGHQADEENPRHEERGGDRPADEGGREAHEARCPAVPGRAALAASPAACSGDRTRTRAPGCSRKALLVTTCWPASSPWVTTAIVSLLLAMVTGCAVTVESGLTR